MQHKEEYMPHHKGTVGILTGGGDTCALNKSIETIKDIAYLLDYRVYGIYGGWKGLQGDGYVINITEQDVNGNIGGSILGSSRTNPYKKDADGNDKVDEVLANIKRYGIDIIISIGGDDTNSVSQRLYKEHGIKVIGFPKTIDNDLRTRTMHTLPDGKEIEAALCPGFPTAADKIIHMTANLHTTAMTHNRIFVVEIMGRDAGWLPATSILGGADMVLIPEIEMTKSRIEDFMSYVNEKYKDRQSLIIGVSEGVRWWNEATSQCELVKASQELDSFGHPRLGGIAAHIANEINNRKIADARSQVAGYVPRSGYASEYDKMLATSLGQMVLKMILKEQYGHMPTMSRVVNFRQLETYNAHTIPLNDIGNKGFDAEHYYDAARFNVNANFKDFIKRIAFREPTLPKKIDYKKIIP